MNSLEYFRCLGAYQAVRLEGMDMISKVLIIDDDEGFLSILGEYLGSLGFDCTLAANSAQARKHLAGVRYAVVLSDLNMPGESGLDLLRHVSAQYPDTPFILMTASCDGRIERESRKRGAYACIGKPFRLRELLDEIKKATRVAREPFQETVARPVESCAV